MKYPNISDIPTTRSMIDAFGGYNHNLRIGENEFYDMRNMTGDAYPVLAVRGRRGFVNRTLTGNAELMSKDKLCYVDGSRFHYGNQSKDIGLSTDAAMLPKHLVSMGAYVIILPDKKYINTSNLNDYGNIEAVFDIYDEYEVKMCDSDGNNYNHVDFSATAPEDPADGKLWMDTSEETHVLNKWDGNKEMWIAIPVTYTKIAYTGLGSIFKAGDGITITAPEGFGINGTYTITKTFNNAIIFPHTLPNYMDIGETSLKIERVMPDMDFVIESGNRLWGCRHGIARNGKFVNEIYASKLGDFKNWNVFLGTAADSYVASVGSDGAFTGAVSYLGYPHFFKENVLHKVYGMYPAQYQIQDTRLRGILAGCDKSIATVNEVLYYVSAEGVMAYDGSMPTKVSDQLGAFRYKNAVGIGYHGKYYVSMAKDGTRWELFTYDTVKGMWHREDETKVFSWCVNDDSLYFVNADTHKIVCEQQGINPEIMVAEANLEWMAETGDIGLDTPESKTIHRMELRMSMEMLSTMEIYISYDSEGIWQKVCELRCTRMQTFTIPVRPRRCDHFRLRFEGKGEAKIISMTKVLEQGTASIGSGVVIG